tara:strand:+ start:1206 stop:2477 length:1272 start_codon:yes stop_codon:yes gene_type:complete
MKNPPHVVILGGGFAGLSAAKNLAKAEVKITLVDRQNHHLFQPLLYQVASGGLSATEIAQPLRRILMDQSNVRIIMDEVKEIDREGEYVHLRKSPPLNYDFLILALGLRTSYYKNDIWGDYALGLKSLDEATEIRRKILFAFEQAECEQIENEATKSIEFVVVGGGPTGVELAGAIAELSHKVLKQEFKAIDTTQTKIRLLEAGPRLLPSFHENHSRYTLKELQKMGVTVELNAFVTDITETSVTYGEKKIQSKLVIWAAGLEAGNAPRTLTGVQRDQAGRIIVEPDLTIPGNERIFVIGDLAKVVDSSGQIVPGVAPAAVQAGKYVAQQIIRQFNDQNKVEFEYLDKGSMATIGRTRAVFQFKSLLVNGFGAWILWLIVHLLFLLGMRNRLVVFQNWLWSYFSWHLGARIITQKPFFKTVVK